MIKIKVIFFASFKELLDCSEIEQQLDDGATINALCESLANKGETWEIVFSGAEKTVKIACNQKMADMSTVLKEGDEVAFFPPVTGG